MQHLSKTCEPGVSLSRKGTQEYGENFVKAVFTNARCFDPRERNTEIALLFRPSQSRKLAHGVKVNHQLFIILFVDSRWRDLAIERGQHSDIFPFSFDTRVSRLCQLDIKLIIAISSIVHIRILLILKLRIFGRYIIISHGFVSSGLFYLVNLIYIQTNSRLIFINKGIITFIPSLIIIWFILCLRNVDSPFPLNLIREIVLLTSLIFRFKYLFLILMIYCLLSFLRLYRSIVVVLIIDSENNF